MTIQSGWLSLTAVWLGLVVALPLVSGCAARQRLHLPPSDCSAGAGFAYAEQEIAFTPGEALPASDDVESQRSRLPPTVNTMGTEPLPEREVTLATAVQIALRNNKQVAVLGFAPQEAATFVQRELSVFDSTLNFDARMANENQQLSQNVSTFGTGQNTQRRSIFGPSAGVPELLSVNRVFATGTQARIGYLLDRNNANPVGLFTTVNPAIRNRIGLTVEHPLWRGAGRLVNEAPILVAQARQDQSEEEFRAELQRIVVDLKVAYWQLYGAERDFRTRRKALEAVEQFLRGEHEKLKHGEADVASVAQAEAQAEQFRIDQVQAYRRRLDAERELRRLMGLPPSDGYLLVTLAQPLVDLPEIDWASAVYHAISRRPNLAAQRAVVQAAEWENLQRSNGLLPNVSLVGQFAPHGLGNTFGSSLSSLSSGQFADWSMGVRYSYAYGRRADRAAAQQAELLVARERATLRNLEFEVLHELQQAYQELYAAHETLRLQGALRSAAEKQLRAREALQKHGGYVTTDLLLRAQAAHADAVRDEWLALGSLNQALARWQYVLGEALTTDVELLPGDAERTPSDGLERRPPPELELLPPASSENS